MPPESQTAGKKVAPVLQKKLHTEKHPAFLSAEESPHSGKNHL